MQMQGELPVDKVAVALDLAALCAGSNAQRATRRQAPRAGLQT